MAFTVIDDVPVRGFHRKLAAACSGGPLLDGYLLGIVGIALTGITAQMHLSAAASWSGVIRTSCSRRASGPRRSAWRSP